MPNTIGCLWLCYLQSQVKGRKPGFSQGLVMSAHLNSARVCWCHLTWIHPWFGDVSSIGYTQGLVMSAHLDSSRAWWCQHICIHLGFGGVSSPRFTQGLVVSAHLNSPKVLWCQLTWIYPGLGDVSVLFILVFLAMYAVFCFARLRPMYCEPNVVSVNGLFIFDYRFSFL